MRRTVNLSKGLNLDLRGGLTDTRPEADVVPGRVAVTPADFPGFLPRLDVAEGDTVAAGSPLMHHKSDPELKIVSPLGGVVESIIRGPRRRIERVVVKRGDEAIDPLAFAVKAGDTSSVMTALKSSGLFALLRQRPYDIVPDSAVPPRDIFVTAMDTAPLALNLDNIVENRVADIEAGVSALSLFTKGSIYIGVAKGSILPDIKGAEMVEFPMLHPAGNAGVQAANIAPVNKGEVIWTLDVVTLARIGRLVLTGSLDVSALVAVTGAEVEKPQVVRTIVGAPIEDLVKDNVVDDGVHHRFISGNVLTGTSEGRDGYLRYPWRQVTVIPEGDDRDEFMGWASLSPSKMSVSRSFLGRFFGRGFNPDARLNGGRRAMIMSEVYDRFFPMDILPEQLIKAIQAHDIDRMEALGVYEVAPEDFALAEYADPSKLELQRTVREGLDWLRSEV
ncbi:MAG: NADH:ubiquinone reductase (Na(+)-transporting) subunit A [Muribaculaceae bacterium]|nr:NADH:ubiquinone reductase (Na(+)-transporting) subunit A [Muribaculaceae bacterium]